VTGWLAVSVCPFTVSEATSVKLPHGHWPPGGDTEVWNDVLSLFTVTAPAVLPPAPTVIITRPGWNPCPVKEIGDPMLTLTAFPAKLGQSVTQIAGGRLWPAATTVMGALALSVPSDAGDVPTGQSRFPMGPANWPLPAMGGAFPGGIADGLGVGCAFAG
jgi:hypothetical protein